MNTPQSKWAGLGYQQVPGLANRYIARWLRANRKNMVRFFHERGMFEQEERLRQIRKSRQGMMAKNQMFQEVLDAYAKLAAPAVPDQGGAAQEPAAETAHLEVSAGPVAVPPTGSAEYSGGLEPDDGSWANDGGSISPVAGEDDGGGVVIEE